MATFGYQNDTSTTVVGPSSANKTAVSKHTPSSTGNVQTGHARMVATGSGKQARFVIYADNADAPGALLAISDIASVPTSIAQVDFTFSTPFEVQSGTPYWIGYVWSDVGGAFEGRRSPSNTAPRWEHEDVVFPDPWDPFDAGGVDGNARTLSGPIVAHVTYTEGSPPTINAGGDTVDWPVNTEFTRAAIVDDGGQTTTVEWEITAGPTGVGTTIDNDETLNWIPTQTGAYTIQATATNPSGSASDSFDISVANISTDTLRLYMTSTDLDSSVPTPVMAPYWDLTSAVAQDELHQLSSVPEGVAEFRGITEATADSPLFVMIGQWVTGPAQSSGTLLSADVGFVMARGQSSADADCVWAFGVRVITPEGTIRGEHFGVFFSTEWPVIADATECVGASATVSPTNIDPVAVQVGDRVMLEIGYRTTNVLTTEQTGTIVFGGTSTPDLAAGDAGGSLSRPSWIDLPITSGLSFANEVAPIPPAGAPGEVYDLSEWHLTTPRDSGSGDAEQIDQPALETFELADTGGNAWEIDDQARIVAAADVDGFTTSGASGATRMELRQRDSNYNLMAFDPHTATQRMTAIVYPDATNISGGTTPRQEMIIWQIHGASGSPPLLLACDHNTTSEPRIRIFKDGPGVSDPIRPFTVGDPVAIRCIVDNGQVELYVTTSDNPDDLDLVTPTVWASTEFADDVDWYFKIGAYNKTEIDSGSTGRSVNKIAYLELNGVVLGPNVTPPTEDPFPQMAHFFGGM